MGRVGLFLVLLLVACAGGPCGGPEQLAELTDHHGEVQRDLARSVGSWRDVEARARFFVGDGLRTGATGRAELTLASDAVALVEANTILRFLDRDPRHGERGLSVEEGAIELSSGALTLDVHTPRALARLERDARVRIVANPRGVSLDVLVGKVTIDQAGTERRLSAGEKLDLPRPTQTSAEDAGRSEAEEKPQTEADVQRETEPVPEIEAVEDAGAAVAKAPESDVDLALDGLRPMTLHVPSLPVSVRIAVRDCDGARLELDGRARPAAGNDALTARLGAGRHRLRVRCGRRVRDTATLWVVRDAATEELPRSAQRVDVEADGRRYTVRYQNVMPVVTVRWSRAREAPSYVLWLRRGKYKRTFTLKRPQHELPAAELREGDHEFWFTSPSGQKSEISSLRIEFDNTARSLTLTEPRDGARASATTTVSGVALLRSRVSANGVPLPLDEKGRFRAQIALPKGAPLWVVAEHPAAGVNYYLRRLE